MMSDLPDFETIIPSANGNHQKPDTGQIGYSHVTNNDRNMDYSALNQFGRSGLQTDSVSMTWDNNCNASRRLGANQPIFFVFKKEDFDYVTLKTIDDQLGKKDIAQLKFLCHDWIPGSQREDITRGFDIFAHLSKKRMLSHTNVELLAELLYRIGRKDILKKFVPNIKEYEKYLSRTPSVLSNYRILLHEIAEDTDSKDLKVMKFTLSRDFPKPKLSSVQDPKDLFTMMEKKELLGNDNLDYLIDLMKLCSKEDMIMKINSFKGALHPGNPIPLDQWNQFKYASHGMNEPLCENTELRGYSQDRAAIERSSEIVVRDLDERGIHQQFHGLPTHRYMPMQQDSIDGDLPSYKMTAIPRGICVIINNYDFYKDPNYLDSKELKPREGSNKDKDDLTHAFTKLQFEIKIYDNVTAQELINIFHQNALRVDHTNYDCFACCILTHGKNQQLYGSDGRLIDISDLTNFYKASMCPSLIGKPKLFFIQACQGREKQEGYPIPKNIPTDLETDDAGHDAPEKIPNEADFLLAFATLPGFVSYRSRSHGSWFVNALVENLNRYAHKYDLMSIMIKVNEEVANMIAPMADDKEYKQVPVPQPTLRKKIYFR